tara:strand:+ start:1088 stop:1498 length:411 start_codon:yes stop_codon:yes gene_type:complete
MVLDSERGCVRGEQNPVSLELELQRIMWSHALDKTRHAPLQSNLEEIYGEVANGNRIIDFQTWDKSMFPGFTPYGLDIGPDDVPVNLAYRCGNCTIIFAGRPDIHESPDLSGFIDYDCGSCGKTMYRGEPQQSLRD